MTILCEFVLTFESLSSHHSNAFIDEINTDKNNKNGIILIVILIQLFNSIILLFNCCNFNG